MLGFQFLATITARLHGNDKADFMPDSGPQKLIALDDTESYFKALAEASKQKCQTGDGA